VEDVLRQQLRESLLGKLQSALNKQPVDLDHMDFLTRHELTLLEAFSEQIEGISGEIKEALQNLRHFVVNDLNTIPESTVERETGPGAPRLISETERIEHLLDTNLPISCIAKILCVPRTAIYRRKRELDLSVGGSYSTMSDRELDCIISTIKKQMPDAGYRTVMGHLVSMGLHIQYRRLMASMHRVDAAGIFSRLTALGCDMQSTYSGRGSLASLHILYLDAATNNRASTAFSFFLKSTRRHGLPSRVRGGQAPENLDIAEFMFATKGTDRESFISGKSLRNHRMTRLWRDVWIAVTSTYYNVLHSLEEVGVLDISDGIHLYGVHYIFVAKLQQDLKTFIGGWNDHPLQTDGGLTPQQLWCLGQNQDRDEVEQLQVNHF
uniref:Integrase core domain-containing protein n=1 Tax=Gouania willdenowi TaxID=441366 RepID=A0A8C5DJN0_GOUWI